jgi:hypothetical protein
VHVTHLVNAADKGTKASEKLNAARQLNKTVVTEQWLLRCFERATLLHAEASLLGKRPIFLFYF